MSRWIRNLFGRPTRMTRTSAARRSNRFSARPRLWMLEDKVVPTTFTVNTTTDPNDGYGVGLDSLRDAIVAANADASPGPHIIDCTGLGAATIDLSSASLGMITISNSMIINGSGKSNLTVTANSVSQIFTIDNVAVGAISVTLNDFTMTAGNATADGANVVIADESVAFNNTIVSNGTTLGGGGAVKVVGGIVTVTNSTFDANTALSTTLDGGAILLSGASSLTVTGSTFSNNSSGDDGGAIATDVSSPATVTISTSTITLNKCFGNTAGSGGGIYINSGGGKLSITDSQVTANTSSANGAGIGTVAGATVTVQNSSISGNSGQGVAAGGGMAMAALAGLLIENSSISGNTLTSTSGANGTGGGIYLQSVTPGSLLIRNSTISGNTASGSVATAGGGGGIRMSSTFTGNLVIQNTTITNNTAFQTGTAALGVGGGGIARVGTGSGVSITLESSLVADNYSPGTTVADALSDFSLTSPAVVIAKNSVFGSNAGGSKFGFGIGAFTDQGGNAAFGTQPMLAALTNNGGATSTHLPNAGSPVREAGSNPAPTVAFDQRGTGFPRDVGFTDIGSIESADTLGTPTGFAKFIPTINAYTVAPTFDVVVTYRDDVGIDTATIDTGDVTVNGPTGALIPTGVVFGGPAQVVVATYTFNTPNGGIWNGKATNGAYVISLGAGAVTDGTLGVPNAALGMFAVSAPERYIVNTTADENDGVAVGFVSLRDAIADASTVTVTAFNEIYFDATVFASPSTITLTKANGQMKISNNLHIYGTGKNNLMVSGSGADTTTNSHIFNVDNASTVTANMATVSFNDMTIANARTATATLDRGAAVFIVSESVTFNNVKFSNNTCTGSGGVVYISSASGIQCPVTFNSCDFTNNSSGNRGGAINTGNNNTATVTLNNCVATGNKAAVSGGFMYGTNARFFVNNSTISGNSAQGGAATNGGGAFYLYSASNLTITNSTIASNSVAATARGGAINVKLQGYSGTITIQNSTIANNGGAGSGLAAAGGGIWSDGTATFKFNISNSIIAKNRATSGPDLKTDSSTGGTATITYSLLGSPNQNKFSSGTGVITGDATTPLDPLLSPFANYGGPTNTYLLLNGSPARNAGDPAFVSAGNDQRGTGFPRILEGVVDMGSTESIANDPSASGTFTNVTVGGDTSYSFTIKYSDNTNINKSTIGTGDIKVVTPYGTFTATFDGPPVPDANDPNILATYHFTAPGGTFGPEDYGTYDIFMEASQVFDDGGLPVPAGKIGSFQVLIPATYVVDITADEDDGNTSKGDISLREAIKLANTTAGVADSISFDSITFAGAQTIALTLGQIQITDSVIITGTGASKLTIDGTHRDRLFELSSAGTVVISMSDMTLTGGYKAGTVNSTLSYGGAFYIGNEELTLTNTVVTKNEAVLAGGAFEVATAGKLTIVNSIVSNNVASGRNNASGNGGAIRAETAGAIILIQGSTFSGNSAYGSGGAIEHVLGTLTIENSTFTGNTAFGTTGSSPNGSNGGAIWFYGSNTMCKITNTTISGNSAVNAGGGVFSNFSGTTPGHQLYIESCTIVNNTAGTEGGGIARFAISSDTASMSGLFTMIDTVVAKNISPIGPDIRMRNSTGVPPGSPGPTSWSSNFVGDTVGIDDTVYNPPLTGDPLLGPLTNNGGTTMTHLPAPGSPLRDAGTGSTTIDQRGVARPINGANDIGAVESNGFEPVGIVGPLPNITGATTVPYTVVVTYYDELLMDDASIGVGDLELVAPDGTIVNPSAVAKSGAAAIETATYTFDAPGGTWDADEGGLWTVRLKAGQVTDSGSAPVAAAVLGTFQEQVARTLVVTNTNDSGAGSLRQATIDANRVLPTVGVNTITFGPLFASAQTITLTTGDMEINASVIISGPGASKVTVDGSKLDRIFNIYSNFGTLDVSMSGMTLTNGMVTGPNTGGGGAIINLNEALTLTDMVVTGNTVTGAGTGGGGILVEGSPGSLTIVRSTISGNSVTGTGSSDGGGIRTTGTGTLTVIDSTISGNLANDDGGGIYIGSGGTANIRNSTISSNTTSGSGSPDGGGIGLQASSVLLLQNTTVAFNAASGKGGGIARTGVATTGSITMESTIVGKNTSSDTSQIASSSDTNTVDGKVNVTTSLVENTIGFTPTGTPVTGDPMLDPLANNGGTTLTHALKAGSPAINTGSNPTPTIAFDQRGSGFNREIGAAADMGAYEVQVVAAPPTVSNVQFGDGTVQRSMVTSIVVTFSEPVTFSGPVANAFTLFRSGTAASIPANPTGNVTLTTNPVNGPASSVTITFSGSFAQFTSLIDGFYDFTIDASQITGAGGNLDGDNNTTPGGNYAVIGDTTNKYFRLYGDGDGNATVNQTDFIAFRNAFNNGPSATWDFEVDGNVTQTDFTQFRNRFNLTP